MTAPTTTLSLQEISDAAAQVPALREALNVERNNVELLEERLIESMSQLELAAEDQGWTRLVAQGQREFTRDGLTRITAACRIYFLKNPLIRKGLATRAAYVWAQGVEIQARANAHRDRAGEQDVNAVIQEFLDDRDNRRALTGDSARTRMEHALGTDGNFFISLWTMPRTGRVQARIVPWDEIADVIANPQDCSEPWYYERRWLENTLNVASGLTESQQRTAWYPALNYRPRSRPARIGQHEVRWDAPIRHVKVNDLEGWRFGVPDAYAALDWARAYREFLEDWAKLVKALSRFAWKSTVPGRKAVAARTKLGAAPTTNAVTGEPNGAGATALLSPDVTLEAIPKTGATIDSESGKPLATMVAAALGLPVTQLLGDPGITGARATAQTLDHPTELGMESRRAVHTEVLRDVCEHVVRESVRAPQGALNGIIGRDEYDRETVTLAGDTEQSIDINWPSLKDLDPAAIVAAVVAANTTGAVPPEIILRLLLTALGESHIDEILDEMVDDQGNFKWPSTPPMAGGLGQAATDAARAGLDPAATGGQQMGSGKSSGQTSPAKAKTAARTNGN